MLSLGVAVADGAKPEAQDLAGQFMVCPVCFDARQPDEGGLLPNAELVGRGKAGSGRAG